MSDDIPLVASTGESYLQLTSHGFLMVALTETKDNVLDAKQLKALLKRYADGIAVTVWDHEKQQWERLTKEMLDV